MEEASFTVHPERAPENGTAFLLQELRRRLRYIGFVIPLLILSVFEFSGPIERLEDRRHEVIHRTPAERANGSWLVPKFVHLKSSYLMKIFLDFCRLAQRLAG